MIVIHENAYLPLLSLFRILAHEFLRYPMDFKSKSHGDLSKGGM